MPAVMLAFGACLAWGGSDFLAGRATRERSLLFVLAGSQAIGLVAAAAVVVAAAPALPPLHALAPAAGAGLAELAAFAALYRALAHGPMTLVAPLSAIGGVVPLAFGLAGGDRLQTVVALALALALAGTALASSGERGGPCAARRGLVLAGLSALGFGLFFVLLGHASESGGASWAVLVSRAVSTAFALALLAGGARVSGHLKPRRVSRDELAWLAPIGLLDIAANGLYAGATADAHVSDAVIGVVSSLYPMATAVLAVIVLRERLRGLQGLGVLITLVAVGVLGASGVGG
jgi:drug/metabolite transporter (DMT)-like permease